MVAIANNRKTLVNRARFPGQVNRLHPGTVREPLGWAGSALPGSGRRGLPGVPVPLDYDQDLLGIGHAAEHHDRAPPAGQQRLGGDQHQGPRRTLAKRGGGVLDKGHGAALKGGVDGARSDDVNRWVGGLAQGSACPPARSMGC